MKNRRSGKQVVISVLIVVTWAALGLTTGTRRVLSAATFTVTNTGDNGGVNPAPGAGTGTLRQAIIDANATAGADTINFAAGVTGTITLASSLPQITESVTINGPAASALTVSGANLYQVFNIAFGVTASIIGLTISNGKAATSGGGIFNGGTLTVTNSTLSGNSAIGGSGGGIFNQGTLTVTNSTFSGNSAESLGGGILSIGGTLIITNSTFSSNSSSGSGGGIYNTGTMKVTNSTFSGNSADSGGGIINFGISATLKNSIIANSPAGGNCAGPQAITAVGVNFSTDNTCGAGFTVVPSTGAGGLNLGPLANNGGPTQTHALLAGSVAIDAVTDCNDLSAMPAPVTTDQRGKPRPADGDGSGSALCDAGAFELQPCVITCPANITQSNDLDQCGAVVNYPAPTTSSDCFTITCSPASGSFFPVGMTTVNCDASGTAANPDCTFTIAVNDTQPPVITLNGANPMSVECHTSFTDPGATASDTCAGTLSVSTSGSVNVNVPGSYTITYSATDGTNPTSAMRTVNIVDTTAPAITLTTNVIKLNTANHKYVTFTVTAFASSASDGCDSGVDINDVVISQVTSDEPENANGNGDGNTTNDIVIAANCKSVQLRAERADESNGRVYTITLKVKDAAGNVGMAVRKVFVPVNSGGTAIEGPGPGYSVTGCSP